MTNADDADSDGIPDLAIGAPWHIAAGENLGKAHRRGLIVSALWSEENGKLSAGALLIHGYPGR